METLVNIIQLFSIENVSFQAKSLSFAAGFNFPLYGNTHRMLSNIYGQTSISEITCDWFQRFKNSDFHVEDQHTNGGFWKMQNWRICLAKTIHWE